MELWFEMDEVHWFIWVKSCGTGARRLDKSNVIMSNWLSHLRTPGRELSTRNPADALKWTATDEPEKFAGFETIRWWKRDGETETARAFRCAHFLTLNFSLWHSERKKKKNQLSPCCYGKLFSPPLNSGMWENVRLSAQISVGEGRGVFIYFRHFFSLPSFWTMNPAPSRHTKKEIKKNSRITVSEWFNEPSA